MIEVVEWVRVVVVLVEEVEVIVHALLRVSVVVLRSVCAAQPHGLLPLFMSRILVVHVSTSVRSSWPLQFSVQLPKV
jgi:hypothetical protein